MFGSDHTYRTLREQSSSQKSWMGHCKGKQEDTTWCCASWPKYYLGLSGITVFYYCISFLVYYLKIYIVFKPHNIKIYSLIILDPAFAHRLKIQASGAQNLLRVEQWFAQIGTAIRIWRIIFHLKQRRRRYFYFKPDYSESVKWPT